MYKQIKFIVLLALVFFSCSAIKPQLASAQEKKENKLDSTDDPHKYSNNFEGIGPNVYILPPPKTEEELLIEQYATKKENQHQIDSVIVNLNLKRELKRMNTFPSSSSVVDSLSHESEEAHLIAVVNYFKNENENYYADWQNDLAVFYILSGESKKANALLIESLKTKEKLGFTDDQLLILGNLALLEVKLGNYIKALSLYDQRLEQAKKTKNVNNQAQSYLAIAKLQATLGDHLAAHNLVIKKCIPLLQRSKNYSGIVFALNSLASFKEMQESDTEAKWIYLQAADVAKKHNDEKGLAISLYNLAQLKNRIGDVNLSIADFMASKDLAIKNQMEDLLVEIQDGLGDAYLKLNDFKAAALALTEYHSLKSNLLDQHLKN